MNRRRGWEGSKNEQVNKIGWKEERTGEWKEGRMDRRKTWKRRYKLTDTPVGKERRLDRKRGWEGKKKGTRS